MELVLQSRKPLTPAETQQAVTATSAPPKRGDIVGHYATALGLISVKATAGRYRAQMLSKTFELRREPEGLFATEYRLLEPFSHTGLHAQGGAHDDGKDRRTACRDCVLPQPGAPPRHPHRADAPVRGLAQAARQYQAVERDRCSTS